MKKKICIITGTRAEYGLLYFLLKRIDRDVNLELQLIVTGTHLSKEYGYTLNQIINDGFKVNGKIPLNLKKDDSHSLSSASGEIVSRVGRLFNRLSPDLVVLLGDRYEILAGALTATLFQLPIAHIHGGEVTKASMDDNMRHAISKLSHLHFVSHINYKKRLIQMGENKKDIHVVGAMGIESLKKLKLLSKRELEKKLGFKFAKRNLMITFHPETSGNSKIIYAINNLFKFLDNFKDIKIIFTYPNSDIGSGEIKKLIYNYVSKNHDRAVVFNSLGQIKYLSTLKFVDGLLGNSSSGVIEAPSLKKGSINIGNRQNGRIQAKSVINSSYSYSAIAEAVNKLYSKPFTKGINKIINPLNKGSASKKCFHIIKNTNLSKIKNKSFFDIVF